MRFVIQCASKKQKGAPSLVAPDGRRVEFVADPTAGAPPSGVLWARPDDPMPRAAPTWRQELTRLVASGEAVRTFLPAWRLYRPAAYGMLVEAFGVERVYVLSAGWGLVRADFPLPNYDITFSSNADEANRRRKMHRFQDFMQLAPGSTESVAFIGGKDYLPLFEELTGSLPARKLVLHRVPPNSTPRQVRIDGLWTHIPYPTSTCTNWHYGAVAAIYRDATAVLCEPVFGSQSSRV